MLGGAAAAGATSHPSTCQACPPGRCLPHKRCAAAAAAAAAAVAATLSQPATRWVFFCFFSPSASHPHQSGLG
jgi:hypothetical protein